MIFCQDQEELADDRHMDIYQGRLQGLRAFLFHEKELQKWP